MVILRYTWNIGMITPAPQGKPQFKRQVDGQRHRGSLEAVDNMTSWMKRAAFGAVLALAASGALAQETNAVTGSFGDWTVFNPPEAPKECFGVTKPKETVNSRDGQPVAVRRGDILLFVTFRPEGGARGEISFSGGYPFAPGSTVGVDVDGTKFELFTKDEWSWPATPEDDAALLAALKKGQTAVLTARSGKGTQTKDTFSLRGFTAAMTDAEARCK